MFAGVRVHGAGYSSILVIVSSMSIYRQTQLAKMLTRNSNKAIANANGNGSSSSDPSPSTLAAVVLPRRLLIASLCLYFFGVAIWLTENALCLEAPGQERTVQPTTKRTMQFLQLHAWWHLLAGLGTYTWIQVSHPSMTSLGFAERLCLM